jgi:hypothetical protein
MKYIDIGHSLKMFEDGSSLIFADGEEAVEQCCQWMDAHVGRRQWNVGESAGNDDRWYVCVGDDSSVAYGATIKDALARAVIAEWQRTNPPEPVEIPAEVIQWMNANRGFITISTGDDNKWVARMAAASQNYAAAGDSISDVIARVQAKAVQS